MDVSPLLRRDLSRALDVIEYQFDIFSKLGTRPISDTAVNVDIHFGDIEKAGMTPIDFNTSLHYLAHELNGLNILDSYDIANQESPWVDDPQDAIDPKFAQLTLATEFKNLVADYRREHGINLEKNEAKSELKIGPLKLTKDGHIYFNADRIKIRPQLLKLCEMLMRDYGKPLDLTDIRDTIFDPQKRGRKSLNSTQKYVSELQQILKQYFGRNVIMRGKNDDYFLRIK